MRTTNTFFSSLSFLLFNKPLEIAICSLGSPDFKWRWVMGRGKNKRPKKSVGLPTKPQKIPWSNFRAFIIYRKLKLYDTKSNGSGVQTDARTPNNVGTCSASWEEYNPYVIRLNYLDVVTWYTSKTFHSFFFFFFASKSIKTLEVHPRRPRGS